jgi:hypothetical protein
MKKANDILKGLEEIRKYLDSIKNINYGGCGYSALAMYLWLKKQGYPYMHRISFVYLYSSTYHYYEINTKFIKHNEGLPTSCSHIMLKVRGKLLDSTPNGLGVDPVKRHNNITEETLRLSLQNGGWNDSFDAPKHLPKIEKKLGIKFGIDKKLSYLC